MSSLQAPMPNTGDTVMHAVSVYRATLCFATNPCNAPSYPRLSVRSAVQAQAQARMSEEKATYAFNQKCAAQTLSACVMMRYGTVRSEAKRCVSVMCRDVYDLDARENHMRCASLRQRNYPLDATYKIPEKQKILPMPKRTLKMIGTAERKASQSA
jgi:hypothetical protein